MCTYLWDSTLGPGCPSDRTASKAAKHVVALGRRKTPELRMRQAAARGDGRPAQDLATAEEGLRIHVPRIGLEPWVRAEGAGRPLPHRAPCEAARVRLGRRLPFDLAGQTATGPSAPGVR